MKYNVYRSERFLDKKTVISITTHPNEYIIGLSFRESVLEPDIDRRMQNLSTAKSATAH